MLSAQSAIVVNGLNRILHLGSSHCGDPFFYFYLNYLFILTIFYIYLLLTCTFCHIYLASRGGIIKTLNSCSTDADTTVFARVYNVGGIVGITANAASENIKKPSAVVGCTNAATVKQNAQTGYAAGVLGSGQNAEGNVVINCTNNGKIVIKNTIQGGARDAYSGIAGILGSGTVQNCC